MSKRTEGERARASSAERPRVLGLSGSLRRDSYNAALLRIMGAAAEERAALEVYDYSAIPLYDPDLPTPEAVERLKAAVEAADAVLFAVPEYNYSVPGVLKNAIDWISRPAYHSVLRDKPVGLISAAGGPGGGARAQQHMKTILLGMAAAIFPWPEVTIGAVHAQFEGGRLKNQDIQSRLDAYMRGFSGWINTHTRSNKRAAK